MEMGWIIFVLIVLVVLALDLGVFRSKEHVIKLPEALLWSGIWIFLSLLFALGIYYFQSKERSILFLTGYLVEKSLSVDNLFLFVVIFRHFAIPREHQHKILFWGIIGAILTRAIIIATGIELVQRFHWIMYVFGVFIIYVGIKTFFSKSEEVDITQTSYYKLINKYLPISWDYTGDKFFIKTEKGFFITSSFVALIIVELSDVLFALDSVPAILSITTDTFLVYTSNLFAILGLRALYFVLAEMIEMFVYLSHAVSFILILVGLKILLHHFINLPEWLILIGIILSLVIAVIASIIKNKSNKD
jgi:tellurite resistance protein TerC